MSPTQGNVAKYILNMLLVQLHARPPVNDTHSACCANTVFAHYCTPHDKPNIHTVLPVTEYTTGKNTHIILPTLPL